MKTKNQEASTISVLFSSQVLYYNHSRPYAGINCSTAITRIVMMNYGKKHSCWLATVICSLLLLVDACSAFTAVGGCLHTAPTRTTRTSLLQSSSSDSSTTSNNLLDLKVKLVNLCTSSPKPQEIEVQDCVKSLEEAGENVSIEYWARYGRVCLRNTIMSTHNITVSHPMVALF
jgi:hypothetical protein